MADLVFLAIVVVFFGAMVLLVRACDRIVGPDTTSVGSPDAVPHPGEVLEEVAS